MSSRPTTDVAPRRTKPAAPALLSSDDKMALALLKGLVEHDDTTAYFGSLLEHEHWRNHTAERGWIVKDGERWTVTAEGRLVYDATGVADLPTRYGMRWYGWTWDRVRPPPIPSAPHTTPATGAPP